MTPFSHRNFPPNSADLSAAALVAADLKLAEAAREVSLNDRPAHRAYSRLAGRAVRGSSGMDGRARAVRPSLTHMEH